MGTDIHCYAEVRRDGSWHLNTEPVFRNDTTYREGPAFVDQPFDWRSPSMFGLLGWPRDHTVTPIAEPRGLPDDVSVDVHKALDGGPMIQAGDGTWYMDSTLSGHSWFTLAELQAVNPDQLVNDGPGSEPLSEFLGGFFDHVQDMAKLGAPDDVRIVFAFGN